jgi:hypothetical protein
MAITQHTIITFITQYVIVIYLYSSVVINMNKHSINGIKAYRNASLYTTGLTVSIIHFEDKQFPRSLFPLFLFSA